MQSEVVKKYKYDDGQSLEVVLNWKGKKPEDDPDRFYDIFDNKGACLNEGEPWHDEGEGVPTAKDVAILLDRTFREPHLPDLDSYEDGPIDGYDY